MIAEASGEGNSVIAEPARPCVEYIKRENFKQETIETDDCGTDETTENSFQNELMSELSKNDVTTDNDSVPCRSHGRWSRIFKKTRDRASPKQIEILVDFVNNHREMINKKYSSSFTPQEREKLWEELTCLLNSGELGGPIKSCTKWRRTWIDIKCEAKARAIAVLKHNQTGEGTNVRPLSPLFEKVINIISKELEVNPEILGAARPEYNIKGNPVEETAENDSNEVDEIVENLFQNESAEEPSTSENITDTDSTPSLHLKSKYRLVPVESLTNFLEIEKEKVAALNALAKEKMIANNLRERMLEVEEERNALYERRTELFVNIANAFLEKL